MKWIMMLLAVLGGMAIGTQAGVNGALGKKVGSLEGALISFVIGTLALLMATIFFGKGNLLSVTSVPKWQLTGGILGAAYIFIMVLIVPEIGAASAIMAIIIGQLLITSIIDHFGLIGGKQIPLDWQRIGALVLMVVAIFLFNKK